VGDGEHLRDTEQQQGQHREEAAYHRGWRDGWEQRRMGVFMLARFVPDVLLLHLSA
jgi:hypothetical protein